MSGSSKQPATEQIYFILPLQTRDNNNVTYIRNTNLAKPLSPAWWKFTLINLISRFFFYFCLNLLLFWLYKGIVNRGDSFRRRRSRSSSLIPPSPMKSPVATEVSASSGPSDSYMVCMMGAPGVGKAALLSQFRTSECINAYESGRGTYTLSLCLLIAVFLCYFYPIKYIHTHIFRIL